MIFTIDTCTAAVYVLLFITRDLSFTEIRYLASDLCNVALSFLGTTDTCALNLSSNNPRSKQLVNKVRIFIPSSNGQSTKTICGVIEHAGSFIFWSCLSQQRKDESNDMLGDGRLMFSQKYFQQNDEIKVSLIYLLVNQYLTFLLPGCHDGQRQPIKVNAGPQQPTKATDGQRRPNEGPQQPTKANTGPQ